MPADERAVLPARAARPHRQPRRPRVQGGRRRARLGVRGRPDGPQQLRAAAGDGERRAGDALGAAAAGAQGALSIGRDRVPRAAAVARGDRGDAALPDPAQGDRQPRGGRVPAQDRGAAAGVAAQAGGRPRPLPALRDEADGGADGGRDRAPGDVRQRAREEGAAHRADDQGRLGAGRAAAGQGAAAAALRARGAAPGAAAAGRDGLRLRRQAVRVQDADHQAVSRAVRAVGAGAARVGGHRDRRAAQDDPGRPGDRGGALRGGQPGDRLVRPAGGDRRRGGEPDQGADPAAGGGARRLRADGGRQLDAARDPARPGAARGGHAAGAGPVRPVRRDAPDARAAAGRPEGGGGVRPEGVAADQGPRGGHPARGAAGAAGGAARGAAALSGRRVPVPRLPGDQRVRGDFGRRHGAGQDGAGAGVRAVAARRGAGAGAEGAAGARPGGVPEVGARRVGERGGEVRAAARGQGAAQPGRPRPRAGAQRDRAAGAQLRAAAGVRRDAQPGALADGDPRRGPADQEPGLQGGQVGARAGLPEPAGADRHADREPAAGHVVADGVRDAGGARQPGVLQEALRQAQGSAEPDAAGGAAAAVPAAADQAAGGAGPAAADRGGGVFQDGGGAARPLSCGAQADPEGAARAGLRRGGQEELVRDPAGADAAAPDLLPPGADRPEVPQGGERQDGVAVLPVGAAARGGAQGAGVLAVRVDAGPGEGAAGAGDAAVPLPDGADEGPEGGDRAVPDGEGAVGVPAFAEGGRGGFEPDQCVVCDPV